MQPISPAMSAAWRADETEALVAILPLATHPPERAARIADRATRLVHGMRAARTRFGGLDVFLKEYGLETTEGIALMCLAEALLRIPDSDTAMKLIADKLRSADFASHKGQSDSLFVNASTWALMLTGRVVRADQAEGEAAGLVDRMLNRLGEPVIRQAMMHAMRVMGRQFVMGRTIDEALSRAAEDRAAGYRHSFDMLGEAARTPEDAERYFNAYVKAIDAIGKAGLGQGPTAAAGISVKLSALHPRYEIGQADRCLPALTESLLTLARQAAGHGIPLCVDAEESERLEMSLAIIGAVARDPALKGWEGFGLAIQAYAKRAVHVCDWTAALSRDAGIRLMPRLVKGAYWDSEIKKSQEKGLEAYPVFTRKPATDVSYIACSAKLLEERRLYPAFATHNAQTLSAIIEMAGARDDYEFQRLHGMGEPLYHQIVAADAGPRRACRVYAPVGSHEDLLPYLVRRLLENGANSSFVNRIQNDSLPVSDIIADPADRVRALGARPHPRIALPRDMFGAERQNSAGIELTDPAATDPLMAAIAREAGRAWTAAPLIDGQMVKGMEKPVTDPSDRRRQIGTVIEADAALAQRALDRAATAWPDWAARAAADRAGALRRLADRLEAERPAVLALLVREAGKTIPDAIAELREAVDFCRYYAARAEIMGETIALPGPTGESNRLSWHARGVFLAISPWNFPLAIFLGQVAAALAMGNAVLAKPAEQTPLIAALAVRLAHEAGIPTAVLQLLPGDGPVIGGALLGDDRLSGVVFTGSTATAQAINRSLAARRGAIIPFIAETGGINAMIADSSALAEQVVDDVLVSSFRSAGQRCSALRLLCVQDSVADKVISMIAGAAGQLVIGDPIRLSTDIGPVIDAEATAGLAAHAARMDHAAKPVFAGTLPADCANGSFFAPRAYELTDPGQLTQEIFGPILHIVRYRADRLEDTVRAINSTGYGLTFGLHTRIDATVRRVSSAVHAGNLYVNRSMIGAVVGVQPFGGEGLSGTGPKAGGPHYLTRFGAERVVSINTTASGGNTSLVTLGED